ncbi:prominin-2 [Toxotes jaculatrix]|uniref:prominin-2 n=1 Tax=Toxotes jaculatrix TaxID=941984 RepID=UPI001B3B0B85|nr:prominin-2 [Toxotes jaculatrix]XP_040906136.1 prominin-2 [Toxotes jaculatrix]
MGLCGSMTGWRCWGSAGALRASVGVMLLGLSLSQSVRPQAACAAAAAPQSLTQPQYQDTIGEETGAGFMAALVHSFLYAVQPNPFPGDLILKIIDFQQVLSNQELIKEILVYSVGFLVCVAIAILYIILMPVVGLFLACCRCCGNCGGKMYQKQTSSIHCRRRTLYWSAFITTVIILAGNICMFKSNEALKVSVDQSPAQLNTTLDNIHNFITAVPQQIDYVVNESYKTIEEVTRNLEGIGYQLGTDIQDRFNGTLAPALRPVRLLNQEITDTNVQLNRLNSSLAQLQSSMDLLQANVTAVKNRINQTLSNSNCHGCENLKPELQSITLDASITVPSLNEFQSAVDKVIKINLTSRIEEVEDYFNSIPQAVTNATKDIVAKSKQLLGDIRSQLSRVTDSIPLSALTNVSGALNTAQREISKITPEVERAEHIRWKVCVAVCCVVLLVVVCNLLGLVLGPLGLTPKGDPTKRSTTANCGGTFLMMGAGFSFLFSWLFMIVVVVLFLLGGNLFTLVCRPWSSGELLKFIDTSGLIPESQSFGLKTNINLSEIYRDCEENQPLWTTLHLDEVINLGDLLNVSKYTERIQQQFENTDITLSTITLLSPEVKNQLSNFSTKAKSFDAAAITQQMNNISRINLNATAKKLNGLAQNQTNNDVKNELQNEAKDLIQIQISIETTIIPQLENLNSTIKSLQSITGKINGTVGEVLSSVGAAQDFLNTNTTQIVKTESRRFLDCQLGYFIAYADWANLTITQQVGRCQPLAGALDTVELVLCSYMVESLNAFWFSLGWCILFFIPSIIFSIKLAKYYRKMKYSDVYENHITMNHIPRAQMKIT